jgi:hypothetical protein
MEGTVGRHACGIVNAGQILPAPTLGPHRVATFTLF